MFESSSKDLHSDNKQNAVTRNDNIFVSLKLED